jgi:hypothetical protein
MDEAVGKQVDQVAGGALTAGDIAMLQLAYSWGQQVGAAFNSGVEAAGGWACYLEQVGTSLGSAE